MCILAGILGFMYNNQNDKAFWNWFQQGIDNNWITEPFCATHDGGYDQMSEEELDQWEQGGDPCMTVTRVIYIG